MGLEWSSSPESTTCRKLLSEVVLAWAEVLEQAEAPVWGHLGLALGGPAAMVAEAVGLAMVEVVVVVEVAVEEHPAVSVEHRAMVAAS